MLPASFRLPGTPYPARRNGHQDRPAIRSARKSLTRAFSLPLAGGHSGHRSAVGLGLLVLDVRVELRDLLLDEVVDPDEIIGDELRERVGVHAPGEEIGPRP